MLFFIQLARNFRYRIKSFVESSVWLLRKKVITKIKPSKGGEVKENLLSV